MLEALQAAPDFEIAGVVRRAGAENKPAELNDYAVVKDIKELQGVDVAILCTPTRSVEKYAKEILAMGINTVDSFDIHTGIVDLRRELGACAKEHGAVSIISAGWDPGSDSIVRTMLEAIAPKGITYTNFGPGMSMGHTVAVKAIDGVKAALSMTIPTGTGIHRRMVYIELKDGYKFEDVAAAIKSDAYFVNDETHVKQVPSVDALLDMGHGVNLTRKGVSGKTQNPVVRIQHAHQQSRTDRTGTGMRGTRFDEAATGMLHHGGSTGNRPVAGRPRRMDRTSGINLLPDTRYF